MAEIVEMIDAAGTLVEVPQAAGGVSRVAPPAAPPSEASGASAPPPDPSAAPADAASPHAASAPAPVMETEEDDGSRDVPRSVQKRFDALTRQREEARREAQAVQQRYDREVAELRGQLEMLSRVQRGDGPGPEPVPLHQQPEPRAEDFASQEEWFRATREWDKAQLKAELVREQHQQAAQQAAWQHQQAMQQREATLRQQHADYDEQIGQLGARGLTPQVYQALLHHEMGPDLAYWLAQHPDALQRMATLPPLMVWRELGKIEARLESNGSELTHPAAPAVPASSAPKPAPLTPVGSGGGGAPTPSLDDPALSQREWEAAAERQYPGLFTRRR